MRWMAALGFLLTLGLFLAALAGFVIMTGHPDWVGLPEGHDVKAMAADLLRHEFGVKLILVLSSLMSLLLVVLFLLSLARPKDDERKHIRFEDEVGDVTIEITALENCLQRLVLEEYQVTWAQVRLRVPPPEVDPTIRLEITARLREMEDLPSVSKQIRIAAVDRFKAILPLDRKVTANARLSLEPSPHRAVSKPSEQLAQRASAQPSAEDMEEDEEPDEDEDIDEEEDEEEPARDSSQPEVPRLPGEWRASPSASSRAGTDRLIIPSIRSETSRGRRSSRRRASSSSHEAQEDEEEDTDESDEAPPKRRRSSGPQ
jgi:hypothetical protein